MADPVIVSKAVCDIIFASAAIDRARRGGVTNIAECLSLVLGRSVTEEEVRDRGQVVAKNVETLYRLLKEPGIAQRTPAWYDARMTMVTASDIAQALNCAKFGNQRMFYEKKCCDPADAAPFDATLPPLRWGIMFEPVAANIYSRINGGVVVHEFGLLRHPTVPYVGASPDGITEDGVMLEIKCPWRRKIDGEVPVQYYYQMQGQLDVCGLDECDYFECEFEACANATEVEFHSGPDYERGVFVEERLLDGGACKYTYPPADLYELGGLGTWADDQTSAGTSVEKKQIWWRLIKSATIRIRRDPVFVRKMFERLDPVWANVERYRTDRAAYVAEVVNTKRSVQTSTPSASASASASTSDLLPSQSSAVKRRPAASRAKKSDSLLMSAYAFVDDAA